MRRQKSIFWKVTKQTIYEFFETQGKGKLFPGVLLNEIVVYCLGFAYVNLDSSRQIYLLSMLFPGAVFRQMPGLFKTIKTWSLISYLTDLILITSLKKPHRKIQ